jgi:hypothetical protein
MGPQADCDGMKQTPREKTRYRGSTTSLHAKPAAERYRYGAQKGFPPPGTFAGAHRTQTREPRAFAGGRQASHRHAPGCAAARANSALDGGQSASLSLRAALGRLPAPTTRHKDPTGGEDISSDLIRAGPLIRRAGSLVGPSRRRVGQSVNFTDFGWNLTRPHRDQEICEFRRFHAKPHRASSGTGKCVNFADFGPNLIGPHREGEKRWISLISGKASSASSENPETHNFRGQLFRDKNALVSLNLRKISCKPRPTSSDLIGTSSGLVEIPCL